MTIKRTGENKGKRGPGRPPIDESKKKKKNFSGYFEPELMERIKALAKSEGRTVNGQIIYILEKYLEQEESSK